MKIICMYLPQYHEIDENNEWWGKGYTEWSAVKKAKCVFKGHNQPKIPLHNNYYDLVKDGVKTWKWQANLAKENGIYGFCIYQYWSCGNQLLEKPMEILLQHPEIDINYCICWANESWTRTWYGKDKEVLWKQEYGNETDWKKHFYYLLKFFEDPRYIKIDQKPVIHIYRSRVIKRLDKMIKYWEKLAKENGFEGIYLIVANSGGVLENRSEIIDAYYNFEPGYTLQHGLSKFEIFKNRFLYLSISRINNFFNTRHLELCVNIKKIYHSISNHEKVNDKTTFLGTFPMWDNTPRRNYKGIVYKNSSPKLFGKNLMDICIKSKKINNEFVYINAWNEWGEGNYLEPDIIHKYEYLNEIKNVVNIING